MINRKNLSHNLIAKVLGFTEFRVKQSYFNTNLTLEHASFALYVVQGKETYGISHHLVSLTELTPDVGVQFWIISLSGCILVHYLTLRIKELLLKFVHLLKD